MKNLLLCSLSAAAVLAVLPSASFAQDMGDYLSKDRFMVRARALYIGTPEDSKNVTVLGSDAKVGDAVTPEVDLTYFFTKNIAAELIAATAQHTLSHDSGLDIGKTWILPPTLTLQYHFTPDSKFSPYLGAGVNYSYFYGEDAAHGLDNLDVDGGWGYAAQAGFDYWLNDHWGLNLDVKKVWLNVDAKVYSGTTPVKADVDLDPWIFGAGVSYRF